MIIVRAEEAQADMVQVSVEDSGLGMDDETLRHVFEVFSRGAPLKRTIKGTSLGLAITKLLVETMGGKVWVKSNLDVGSTFYFILRQWRQI
ncbi:MAG: hypothetical protein HQK97_10080 [Nitrospirae bacterium]|nr:hypothetical protein [Nitrospirota bacterium]